MQQGLHLLAQGRHPLQLPEHPQGDEIRHRQGAAHGRLAHPRQGPGDGIEQVSQDGVIGEAVHQGLETIEHGKLPYITVFQQKMRAYCQPLVKSFLG